MIRDKGLPPPLESWSKQKAIILAVPDESSTNLTNDLPLLTCETSLSIASCSPGGLVVLRSASVVCITCLSATYNRKHVHVHPPHAYNDDRYWYICQHK